MEQPQNPEPPIPEFIPAISTQPACASNLPASLEASSPLKKSAASQQQQENSGPQTSGEEDDDIAKKTRRIASKLHIMASKKQLDPAVRRRSQPLAALLVLKRCFFSLFPFVPAESFRRGSSSSYRPSAEDKCSFTSTLVPPCSSLITKFESLFAARNKIKPRRAEQK